MFYVLSFLSFFVGISKCLVFLVGIKRYYIAIFMIIPYTTIILYEIHMVAPIVYGVGIQYEMLILYLYNVKNAIII